MIFERVVGHAVQREILARTLARGVVHNGYLFSGPPGVGKRLVAEEFARVLLCREGGAEPCGACPSCRGVGGGAHPDYLVLAPVEGKKSISVDSARDLGAWLAQSPAWGRRKVALVDPAEALTNEAANALLKTLEEPPPGRVIVLVAARAGALPATVRSRCQHLPFGALADEEVAEVLRRNRWPAQAARQAAALAEGSPGAALARDGKSWQESADAVRTLLESLGRGDRGAALAFAERHGEQRERTLLAIQSLLGLLRDEARDRLGASAARASAPPSSLGRLGGDHIVRLLSTALETHRRLEGDRPPNAKLALATLLLGAGAGLAGAEAGHAPRHAGKGGRP